MVDRIDRLGRLQWECPRCARRKAGLCADCPRTVAGTVGKAERCARCRRLQLRADQTRYRQQNPEHVRRQQRENLRKYRVIARGGRRPMTRQECGHLAGLARARNLSPARRSEIARRAGQARWAKARAA